MADLKGQRVGVAGFGLFAERAARLVLAKLGLNPEKDVTLLQTGGEATRLAALVNGSIDATVLNPPVHKRAVEAGMRVMANMAEMGIPFQNSALVTTQRYIAKNPDVMRRLVKSFVEGIHLIRTNPEVTSGPSPNTCASQTRKNWMRPMRFLMASRKENLTPHWKDSRHHCRPEPKIPAARTADPKDFVDVRFLEELDRRDLSTGFIGRIQAALLRILSRVQDKFRKI